MDAHRFAVFVDELGVAVAHTKPGVAPEVILFSSLAAAGMPFLFLIGAAPNAIAYESGQFSTREFFTAGIPASIILLLVVTIFAAWIWPLMGMPVRL